MSDKLSQLQKQETDKNENFKRSGRKFAKQIFQDYGDKNMSLEKIYRKAYGKRGKLSNEAFNYFLEFYPTIANNNAQNSPDDIYTPRTAMTKALGTVYPSFKGVRGKPHVSDADKPHLNAIRAMLTPADMSMQATVAYETLVYNGPTAVMASSQFDPKIHDPSTGINPIIAALFVNKIEFLERRILTSNLASMVSNIVKGVTPRTVSDYEFFVDITRETNSNICDGDSIFGDLKRRCELQRMIRQSVHNFRNGRIYDRNNFNFMLKVNECKMAPTDHPHLLFIRDEGVMLSRIMNAFSLRPIKILTASSNYQLGPAPLPFPHRPIHERAFIEVRLPYPGVPTTPLPGVAASVAALVARPAPADAAPADPADPTPVSLLSALQQPMWQMAGPYMYAQQQQIFYCQDVLIFYINRRVPAINWQMQYFQYQRIPAMATGHDTCNTTPIKNIGECQDDLNKEAAALEGVTRKRVTYTLSSFVAVKTADINHPSGAMAGGAMAGGAMAGRPDGGMTFNNVIKGTEMYFSVEDIDDAAPVLGAREAGRAAADHADRVIGDVVAAGREAALRRDEEDAEDAEVYRELSDRLEALEREPFPEALTGRPERARTTRSVRVVPVGGAAPRDIRTWFVYDPIDFNQLTRYPIEGVTQEGAERAFTDRSTILVFKRSETSV